MYRMARRKRYYWCHGDQLLATPIPRSWRHVNDFTISNCISSTTTLSWAIHLPFSIASSTLFYSLGISMLQRVFYGFLCFYNAS